MRNCINGLILPKLRPFLARLLGDNIGLVFGRCERTEARSACAIRWQIAAFMVWLSLLMTLWAHAEHACLRSFAFGLVYF